MRAFNHSKQMSFFDHHYSNEETSFTLKIVCNDGALVCDRLLFILWSKEWRDLLDPDEETSVLIYPDVKKRTVELLLSLLKKGDIKGFESDFNDLFELALDFLADTPGGFSNFETSDKMFEFNAASIQKKRKNRNNSKFISSENYTCEFCVSNFFDKQAKDRHVENCHQPKESHICTTCNMSFKSKIGLKTHLKVKHSYPENHKCKICFEKFTNEANMKRHVKSMHDKEYICLICYEAFSNERKLEKHKAIYGHLKERVKAKDEFECSKCDFKTSRKDSLLRHKRLKHQAYRKDFTAIEETLRENSKWTCSKCNKTFSKVEEIESHVINCQEFKCYVCDKEFTMKSSLKRHLEKMHPTICKKCGKRFKFDKSLKKHEKLCSNLI